MTTTEKNDRLALLTSAADQTDTNTTRNTKRNLLIITGILIIALLMLILIIFVIDVFDLFKDNTSKHEAGMIGLWPSYGGSQTNQQTSPIKSYLLTNENIANLSIKCIYLNVNGTEFMGYPTIDNQNYTYLSAGQYITSIDLNTCQVRWKQRISALLGFTNPNISISSQQALTIFRDSNGTQGLLLGAPSIRNPHGDWSGYPPDLGCYALAVYLNNGSFWWKIQIGQDFKPQDYGCSIHGFYVDGNYGYGTFGQSGVYNAGPNGDKNFIGRFIKINIDTHELDNVWYSFDYNLTNEVDVYNFSYRGSTLYNFPAIGDKYVAFGTSNLWTIPYKIQECLVLFYDNNYNTFPFSLNESVVTDICGNNKSLNPYYRCMSQSVYPDSLIILNKETFELQNGFRLIGMDQD
eukprot:79894_1